MEILNVSIPSDSMLPSVRKERDRLPAYHQSLLDEQLARLRHHEAALVERDGVCRADEARKLAAVDKMRADAQRDLELTRSNLYAEISLLREDGEARKLQLENERNEFYSLKSVELSSIEARKFELCRIQKAIDEERNELIRTRTELEVRVRMVEPNLVAAEQDRDEAKALRNRALLELSKAEARTSAVLEADRALNLRETVLVDGLRSLEQMKKDLLQIQRGVDAERTGFVAQTQNLDAERFQLHAAAVEMKEQVMEMQKAMKLLTKCNGLDQRWRSPFTDDDARRTSFREDKVSVSNEVAVAKFREEALHPLSSENSPTLPDPAMQRAMLSLNNVAQALEGTAVALQHQLYPSDVSSRKLVVMPPPAPKTMHGNTLVDPFVDLLRARSFEDFMVTSSSLACRDQQQRDRGMGDSVRADDIASVLYLQNSLDNADALATSLKNASICIV
jgi:hypothetical protein